MTDTRGDIGQEPQEAGPLDGSGKLPLMPGAGPSRPPSQDPAPVRKEGAQLVRLPIINLSHLIHAESTHPPTGRIPRPPKVRALGDAFLNFFGQIYLPLKWNLIHIYLFLSRLGLLRLSPAAQHHHIPGHHLGPIPGLALLVLIAPGL